MVIQRTIGGRRPGAGDIVLSPPTNEVRLRVALAEAKASQRCCLRHSMPAGAASRYALGAGGVGAVRPAPAASLISACATRSALGARRCAPRALRACVPGGAAAGCHRRHALRARRRWRGRCAPGRLRQPSRGLALRARRRWRGRCAPGCLHVPPPITRALPLGGGDVEDAVRFALLETLNAMRASRSCRGRGWGGVSDIIMRKCAGERSCAAAACAA